MMVLAGAVAAWCAASLAVMAVPAFGAGARADSWGKAIEVLGLARLSAGHGGTLNLVSCSSAGNCSAGGNYTDRLGHQQAFVVNEKNGSWGKAIEVPRLAALNTGEDARVVSLSCGSAGNCARLVGHGDRGTWISGAEHRRVCTDHVGVMYLGGLLRRRRERR
jgi:hypothetical protein